MVTDTKSGHACLHEAFWRRQALWRAGTVTLSLNQFGFKWNGIDKTIHPWASFMSHFLKFLSYPLTNRIPEIMARRLKISTTQ